MDTYKNKYKIMIHTQIKTENFELKSGEVFLLKKLRVNKIQFISIELLEPNDPSEFFRPIQYIQHLNGKIESGYIVPNEYLSPMATHKKTDRKMDRVVITSCKNTEMKISQLETDKKDVRYKISYKPLVNIELDIYVTESSDGFTYSLPLESKKKLKELFHVTNGQGRLFVSKDIMSNFQSIHGSLINYLPTTLFGLNETDIQKVDFRFINTLNSKILYKSTAA